jgi:hypothetical protein
MIDFEAEAREWLMGNVNARDFCWEGQLEEEDFCSLAAKFRELDTRARAEENGSSIAHAALLARQITVLTRERNEAESVGYRRGVEAAIKICASVDADPTVGAYTGAEHCVIRIRRAILPPEPAKPEGT